jgi:hypothetical protein
VHLLGLYYKNISQCTVLWLSNEHLYWHQLTQFRGVPTGFSIVCLEIWFSTECMLHWYFIFSCVLWLVRFYPWFFIINIYLSLNRIIGQLTCGKFNFFDFEAHAACSKCMLHSFKNNLKRNHSKMNTIRFLHV